MQSQSDAFACHFHDIELETRGEKMADAVKLRVLMQKRFCASRRRLYPCRMKQKRAGARSKETVAVVNKWQKVYGKNCTKQFLIDDAIITFANTYTHFVRSTGCWRPHILFFIAWWNSHGGSARTGKIGVERSFNYFETQILNSDSVRLTDRPNQMEGNNKNSKGKLLLLDPCYFPYVFLLEIKPREHTQRTQIYRYVELHLFQWDTKRTEPVSLVLLLLLRLPHCFKCITNSERRSAESLEINMTHGRRVSAPKCRLEITLSASRERERERARKSINLFLIYYYILFQLIVATATPTHFIERRTAVKHFAYDSGTSDEQSIGIFIRRFLFSIIFELFSEYTRNWFYFIYHRFSFEISLSKHTLIEREREWTKRLRLRRIVQ